MSKLKHLLEELRRDFSNTCGSKGFSFTLSADEKTITAVVCYFDYDDDGEIVEATPDNRYPLIYLSEDGLKLEKGGWHKLRKESGSDFLSFMTMFGSLLEAYTE